VRTAIRKHFRDFVALVGMFALALGVGGYILINQTARGPLPFVEDKPFEIEADFVNAQAVTPGQGQSVRIAGVKVGTITNVDVVEGRARVRLALEPKYGKRIRTDAKALLRPRTGLKDMFVELDPGTEGAPRIEEKGLITAANTAPDVDPDEVFDALDSDTRSYLQLLIAGGGKGLKGRGEDLRSVFERLEPLHRDLAKVTGAIADRRRNLRRLVHNYGELTTTLGRKDEEIVRLVEASESVLSAFASQDQNISSAVSKFPSALRETESTLAKLDTFAGELGPTLDDLRPAFRELDDANKAVLPFAKEAEPITRKEIRPFVRSARPYVRDLRPAAEGLSQATPDLTSSFEEINRFFNMGAHNPGGRQGISDDCEKNGNCTKEEIDREEGYLYWTAWLGNNTNSLFSTADASGPFRRAVFMIDCTGFKQTAEAEGMPPEILAVLFGSGNPASPCPEGTE
jgi:phospholipid/cholesterol/gamma-HCH transport system substrate-binding protein